MQQPPFYPPPPVPGAPPAPQKNGAATAGLVCSLVGIPTSCMPLLSLLGLIFGAVGLSKASKIGGAGRGAGLAGVIIGIVGLILCPIIWVSGVTAAIGMFQGVADEVAPVAEKYFTLVSDAKYDEAYEMTSREFKTETNAEKFREFCDKTNANYGKYEKKEFKPFEGGGISMESKSGSDPQVTITYFVDFGKEKKVRRTVIFIKRNNAWQIMGDNMDTK